MNFNALLNSLSNTEFILAPITKILSKRYKDKLQKMVKVLESYYFSEFDNVTCNFHESTALRPHLRVIFTSLNALTTAASRLVGNDVNSKT